MCVEQGVFNDGVRQMMYPGYSCLTLGLWILDTFIFGASCKPTFVDIR